MLKLPPFLSFFQALFSSLLMFSPYTIPFFAKPFIVFFIIAPFFLFFNILRRTRLKLSLPFYLLLASVCIAIVSSILGNWEEFYLKQLLQLSFVSILSILIVFNNPYEKYCQSISLPRTLEFNTCFLFTSSLFTFPVFFKYITSTSEFALYKYRFVIGTINPNVSAFNLFILLIASFNILLAGSNVWKISFFGRYKHIILLFSFLNLLLSFVFLILTGSRGVILACLSLLFLYLFFSLLKVRGKFLSSWLTSRSSLSCFILFIVSLSLFIGLRLDLDSLSLLDFYDSYIRVITDMFQNRSHSLDASQGRLAIFYFFIDNFHIGFSDYFQEFLSQHGQFTTDSSFIELYLYLGPLAVLTVLFALFTFYRPLFTLSLESSLSKLIIFILAFLIFIFTFLSNDFIHSFQFLYFLFFLQGFFVFLLSRFRSA